MIIIKRKMNKEEFKRDYPCTYKAIMSGDTDKIIEQVALIYHPKDVEMKKKKSCGKCHGKLRIIIDPDTFENNEDW